MIALFLAVLLDDCIAEESIIGEWLAVERTRGGLGASKSYRPDGIVNSTFGALVDFKYETIGNKLILSFSNEPDKAQVFEISGAKLILSNESGLKEELTRLSGDEHSGIVGKWIGDHYTGAKQILHFTARHNCYLAVPMMSANGSYLINGNKLTETYDNGKEDLKWAISENILTLSNTHTGENKKYMRKE